MILDLFAGPGGWDEGLRVWPDLHAQTIGLEWDRWACATRAAAGHHTIRTDIATFPRGQVGKLHGLIASPPCQDFSIAGKGAGRTGERGRLIDTVPEWVDDTRPEWIACEQVPPAAPIWREHADYYRELGYSVWVGVVNAADYGVPQTRRRAILIASQGRAVDGPPPVTHSKSPEPSLFDQLEPWVTMAEALGWTPDGLVGFPRKNDTNDGGEYRRRDLRSTREPAQTVTEKARSWKLVPGSFADTRPAPTITGGGAATGGAEPIAGGRERAKIAASWVRNDQSGPPRDPEWPLHRPATTIAGRDLVPDPGATRNRQNMAAAIAKGEPLPKTRNDGYRVTVEDALRLQSFRADYPVQGSKTARFLQVGNAMPPLLARHIIANLTGRDLP